MNPLWIVPLVAVLLALGATGWATRSLRREAAALGTAAEQLTASRGRLDRLAQAAASLRDSGHPPTRR